MFGGDLRSLESAPAVLKFFFDSAREAPGGTQPRRGRGAEPNNQRLIDIESCYSGPAAKGEKVHGAAAPGSAIAGSRRTPYVKLQHSGDVSTEYGQNYYIKGGFVQKATPAFVDTMIGTIEDASCRRCRLWCSMAGGAIKRVKPGATAFAQRAARSKCLLYTRWEDPAQNETVLAWIKSAWAKLEPNTYGFYVNEFNEDAGRMKATYGDNYDRMVALKTKYDPANLFRLNANVTHRGRPRGS